MNKQVNETILDKINQTSKDNVEYYETMRKIARIVDSWSLSEITSYEALSSIFDVTGL